MFVLFFLPLTSFIQVWVSIVLTDHGRIVCSSGVAVLSVCPVSYHPMPALLCTTSLSPLLKATDTVSGMCFFMLHRYITAVNNSFCTERWFVTASYKELWL